MFGVVEQRKKNVKILDIYDRPNYNKVVFARSMPYFLVKAWFLAMSAADAPLDGLQFWTDLNTTGSDIAGAEVTVLRHL